MKTGNDQSELRERLFALRDEKNAAFVAKLIPNIPPETILGARTPALRKLAKELYREGKAGPFMDELPHAYFEENGLHAFFLEQERDFSRCLEGVERFLPFVDNWATCDSLNPPVFKKHREELLEWVQVWLRSERSYTLRFGIKMLMTHFLDADFREEQLKQVSVIESEEYYVNMMRAWYFATALAKQWDAAIPLLQENQLDPWTHAKTIQKAVESFRISEEQKALLRGLRQKGKQ